MKHWWLRFTKSSDKKIIEDALKCIHEREWQGNSSTQENLAVSLQLSTKRTAKLCQRMQMRNLVHIHNSHLALTQEGEQLAVHVIRAHRLWERYLADEARMPLTNVHAAADRREHTLSTAEIHALEAALGYPLTDPHGDPIPTAEGELPRYNSIPLTDWGIGKYAKIVHLEDEPVEIYAQIASLGLFLGQRIKIISSNETCIVITDSNKEFSVAPIVAANIHITECDPITEDKAALRLNALPLGKSAVVLGIDTSLKGFTRRRLLDLGLTSGANITSEYRSFLGDPVAYRVRGALIALRDAQAQHILIQEAQALQEASHE